MMAAVVYILCTATCLVCTVLLWRGFRRTQLRLLFWSAACFIILAIANALLFVDLEVLPGVDLLAIRSSITLTALLVLLYGLIFESN